MLNNMFLILLTYILNLFKNNIKKGFVKHVSCERRGWVSSEVVAWELLGLQPDSYEIWFVPLLQAFTATHQVKVRGSADKSLALSGRKQTTATKVGIYSTHSPRSSVNFLARCCNFCKSLKEFGTLSVQPGLHGGNVLHVERKMAKSKLFFFQSREQVVDRRDQMRRIGWVIKTLEAQVGQFLLRCKCHVRRGIVVQEQDPFGKFPAASFLQNALQLHHQRCVILRVDSLVLWKIMNNEDTVLMPQNREENFSSRLLHSEFSWGGPGWAAMPPLHWLLLCLPVIVI